MTINELIAQLKTTIAGLEAAREVFGDCEVHPVLNSYGELIVELCDSGEQT